MNFITLVVLLCLLEVVYVSCETAQCSPSSPLCPPNYYCGPICCSPREPNCSMGCGLSCTYCYIDHGYCYPGTPSSTHFDFYLLDTNNGSSSPHLYGESVVYDSKVNGSLANFKPIYTIPNTVTQLVFPESGYSSKFNYVYWTYNNYSWSFDMKYKIVLAAGESQLYLHDSEGNSTVVTIDRGDPVGYFPCNPSTYLDIHIVDSNNNNPIQYWSSFTSGLYDGEVFFPLHYDTIVISLRPNNFSPESDISIHCAQEYPYHIFGDGELNVNNSKWSVSIQRPYYLYPRCVFQGVNNFKNKFSAVIYFAAQS